MAIELTPKAIENVNRIKKEQSVTTDKLLRISVVGGGCSGLSYKLSFDVADEAKDKVFTFGDVKVAVDPRSYLVLNGMIIDFTEGLNGTGFTFENPNATKTCGCGTSFKA
jgi:iron-sulfur cluster assembly protein